MADKSDKQKKQVFVVMWDAVSNFGRGCRVSIDDLFHTDLPGREQHWQRLVDMGAVRPESDAEAAAVPKAEPVASPPPIVPAGMQGNFGVLGSFRAPGINPGSVADSTSVVPGDPAASAANAAVIQETNVAVAENLPPAEQPV